MFLFYVYLSAEIFLWQAIGFVGFYAFFVGLVFYMDLGVVDGRGKSGNSSTDLEEQKELVAVHVDSDAKVLGSMNDKKRSSGFPGAYGLISKAWEIPVATLKLSIPEPVSSQWIRKQKANGGFIMSASHNSGGPEYDWGGSSTGSFNRVVQLSSLYPCWQHITNAS
ncbi:cation/calcium exchanger 5 isoform X2 [Arachis hypogaea]|uniref:cation/calcium exchanger 5 isoform X2 n=2 Tax=Arachis hypogaea TaxID=3818 RepID=UPI000DECFBA9|nr:cation/calcium exchanger 5 isoform X4 [Arachis hypogaea]